MRLHLTFKIRTLQMSDVMYFTSLYFLPLVALLYTVKLMQYLLERFFNSLNLCSVAHAWQSTTTP